MRKVKKPTKTMREAVRAIERVERARRFATALQSTTARYLDGFIKRPTWKAHMAGLWGLVEAAGLAPEVTALVDPLSRETRRLM